LGIDFLGKWPVVGEEARRKPARMIVVSRDKMLRLIHGDRSPMSVVLYVSNDYLHVGEFVLPAGGPSARVSEIEDHDGDEVFYVLEGPVAISLPDTRETFEVQEGDAFLIPEGTRHQYANFTDKTIRAVFAVAPQI
jgi:quercetin dioxygenase-like cupin family protein